MSLYRITFVVQTDADPSAILDAAHCAGDDLVAHIETEGRTEEQPFIFTADTAVETIAN